MSKDTWIHRKYFWDTYPKDWHGRLLVCIGSKALIVKTCVMFKFLLDVFVTNGIFYKLGKTLHKEKGQRQGKFLRRRIVMA